MKLFARTQQWLTRLLGNIAGVVSQQRYGRRRKGGRGRVATYGRHAQALEPRLVLAAPTLNAISNVTLLKGSPLLIALNANDPEGQPLRFTVTSSNSAVTPVLSTTNRSLRMDVRDFGTMTFELFEDRVPRVTNHIAALANGNFYDQSIFHRVINNFVIQGGDPHGNPIGTGGSDLGDFDDQFDVDLQHNQTGILSMAKTTDDTNDSQFFITEGAARHLDFNHSIFGFMTTGESVRQAISNVAVGAGSRPVTDVVLTDVSVFQDSQNRVLMLKAPPTATGTTRITVTVEDAERNRVSRTFDVTLANDTVNSNPFLKEIPKLRTSMNSAFQFGLEAVDVEGDTIGYTGQDRLLALNPQPFIPVLAPQGLGYSVDATTGSVTLAPSNNLIGTHEFMVAVGRTFGSLDYQVPKVEIVAAAEPLVVSGADHPVLNQANDGRPDTFVIKARAGNVQVFINDRLSYECLRSSVSTLTINGSSDDDIFIVDFASGVPFSDGSISFVGGTGADEVRYVNNGAPFPTVMHQIPNAARGVSTIGTMIVTASEVEGLLDQLSVNTRTIQYGTAANVVAVEDHGTATDSVMKVTGTRVLPVRFSAPTAALVVNGAGGDDDLRIASVDRNFQAQIRLQGGAGNDTLLGGAGNEFFTGGAGNDSIDGQGGTDTLTESVNTNFTLTATTMTGLGTDTFTNIERAVLVLGDDANTVNASTFVGPIEVQGNGGDDTIYGSPFNDTLIGGVGFDRLAGNGGNDLLVGGNDNDALAGGAGADTLQGELGNDRLDGGGGSGDVLIGGPGRDLLNGGAGIDIVQEADNGRSIRITNTALSGLTTGSPDTLAEVETIQLTLGNESSLVDATTWTGSLIILAGDGNDTIKGGAGADAIRGEGGNDSLMGGGGNDTLDGGDNDDILIGGAGNDFLQGKKHNDVLIGQDGDDELDGGDDVDILFGNEGLDVLTGGKGNDLVSGGLGTDTLAGGEGTDTLVGGNGGAASDTTNDENDFFGFEFSEHLETFQLPLLTTWIRP